MELGVRAGAIDTPTGNTNSQSPQGYAIRIKEHADRAVNIDIHSGVNCRALAVFLNKPYTSHYDSTRIKSVDTSTPPLVCVHSAIDGSRPTTRLYRPVSTFNDFIQNPPSIANNAAQVIWLSGFPAPEWINAIGAQYRVDPEFFRRQLIFLQSRDSHDIVAMPSLTQRMLTIRLTTICRRPIVLSRAAIEQARSESVEAVSRHQQKLRTGDSIVRRYSVFDNSTFTIEQDVSIYVKRSKQHNGWMAVICSDLGKDLTKGPMSPWNNISDTPGMVPSCEPVVMHVPKLALERPPRYRAANSNYVNSVGQMTQNVSFLAETFATLLPSDAPHLDIRDALHDVFAFAAAAECQFLDMMQGLIDRELQLQSTGKQTEWTLSNLRYFKSSIDDHIVNLEGMLGFLQRTEIPRWSPHPHTPHHTSRNHSPSHSHLQIPSSSLREPLSRLSTLHSDHKHLLLRATKLSARCVENTTILMNIAMLEESKKAIVQADGLKRLTLVAFFFLPLSLTTSFFGMNFVEFGTGRLSLWVCFVCAAPLLVFSTMLCFLGGIGRGSQEEVDSERGGEGVKGG